MSGRVSTLSCVLVLAAPALAFAGPLNKKLVAADATWVIHVDVEGAAASSIGKAVLECADLQEGMRELHAECGVDFLKDVKGVTVWGREAEGEDGVVVVHTTGAVDEVIEKFRAEAGIEEIESGGYELLKVDDGSETHYGHVRKTRRGDDRMVFIARRAKDLVGALEVADGEEPSAASAGAVIKDQPGEASVVFISIPEIQTLVPGEAKAEMPPIFGMIHGVRFEAGERGEDLFAEGAITAATSEDADTVRQAALGAIAFGKMVFGADPDMKDLMKFANSIKIEAEDRTVTFKVRCDAAEVRRVIAEANQHHRKVKTDAEDEGDADEAGDEPAVAAPEKARKKKGE